MAGISLRAALYARVSSELQTQQKTIASQVEAIESRLCDDSVTCDPDLRFIDEGYSGASLIRPALERLRDQAAAGAIDRLYVHAPDRLARKYAYQVLLVEELVRGGVEVIFLTNPMGHGPEESLLVQVQGMIAEYERAKIMERSRRGKQHAARRGSVSVLSAAPYGYHYISRRNGDGVARYQVIAEEARVVRQIFEWVGRDRCSMSEVARRLQKQGIASRTGRPLWDRATIHGILKNPAYKGTAAYGKTRGVPYNPQHIRPARGRPEFPKHPMTRVDTDEQEQTFITVPSLVSEELFAAVQVQLAENRRRCRVSTRGAHYLLQGLLVCRDCGYACYGCPSSQRTAGGQAAYAYYKCRGSQGSRFGGQPLCQTRAIRTDRLDAAVWEDVASLLSDPVRVRQEYRRRLEGRARTGDRESGTLSKLVNNARTTISRLIDVYGDGLLEKAEFEPRIRAARTRLSSLEEEQKRCSEQEKTEAELKLVIGQLEEFARRVSDGLQSADWLTKRQILRALVKQVEVANEEVRIVYRISPAPFEVRPQQGLSQHCWGRRR